jgi:hypothetical protein
LHISEHHSIVSRIQLCRHDAYYANEPKDKKVAEGDKNSKSFGLGGIDEKAVIIIL